jgi:hypothetical protein
VSGTLVDAEGKPLGYIMAEVFNEMGDAVASTFTDETGYFELYDLASGTFEIRWPPDVGLSYFIIPEMAPRDTTLGTIVPVALQEGAL